MKSILRVLGGCIFLIFSISGCASGPKVVKVNPLSYSPNFKVISGSLKGGLGIKTALLEPGGEIKGKTGELPPPAISPSVTFLQLLGKQPKAEGVTQELPDEFRANLLKSIEAIALQKGYQVVSAFKSLEVMTYKNKRNIDLLIVPEIHLRSDVPVNCKTAKRSPTAAALMGITLGKGRISCVGHARYTGQLVLEIIEPLTREKLFIKSLEFHIPEQPIEVEVEYSDNASQPAALQLAYQTVAQAGNTALNKGLEEAYTQYIKLFKDFLPEGEEAKQLFLQARKLKTMKTY